MLFIIDQVIYIILLCESFDYSIFMFGHTFDQIRSDANV